MKQKFKMKEYLVIGKIIKVVGLKGELRVFPSTDFSFDRFKKNQLVYIGEDKKEYKIKTARNVENLPIISFENYQDINLIEELKNQIIYIEKNTNKLPKDTYYFSDLIDCEVVDENNNYIGKVNKVEDYPAQRTLRVKTAQKKDILIPFVNAFIINVDINNKKIIVKLIEGMLWNFIY